MLDWGYTYGWKKYASPTLEQLPHADVRASSISSTEAGGPGRVPACSISARPQEQLLHARLLVEQPPALLSREEQAFTKCLWWDQ